MNLLEQTIHEYACQKTQQIAIQGEDVCFDYQQLINEIELLSSALKFSDDSCHPSGAQRFAIIMDNHPAWAVIDLALMFNHQCSVPLPKFFSIEQLTHALIDSNVAHLILSLSLAYYFSVYVLQPMVLPLIRFIIPMFNRMKER